MVTTLHRRVACAVTVAQVLTTSAFAQPLAPGPTDIGVAGAVSGRVAVTNQQIVGEIVHSGRPIYLGDLVETDAAGRLQVLLRDETVFTIGPNSAIRIDTFVYDPAAEAGQLKARAVKGTFRFVTGKIARHQPQDMEVALPAGVIGIRGTIVAGRVEGQKSRIVLLGPGAKNNAGERPGQITVANDVGGRRQSVALTRPGYGTEIAGAGIPPTPPAPVPPAELQALNASLEADAPASPTAPADAPPAADAPAADLAGQSLLNALLTLLGVDSLSELAAALDALADESAHDSTETVLTADDVQAKWDEVRTIPTGQGHYEGSGTLSDPNGGATFSVKLDIDFGTRQIGGGNSKVTAVSTHIDSAHTAANPLTFPISSTSFGSLSGDATITFGPISNTASPCSSICQANSIIVEINKAAGAAAGSPDLAKTADVDVVIKNTSTGHIVSGLVDDLPRESGLSQ